MFLKFSGKVSRMFLGYFGNVLKVLIDVRNSVTVDPVNNTNYIFMKILVKFERKQ